MPAYYAGIPFCVRLLVRRVIAHVNAASGVCVVVALGVPDDELRVPVEEREVTAGVAAVAVARLAPHRRPDPQPVRPDRGESVTDVRRTGRLVDRGQRTQVVVVIPV